MRLLSDRLNRQTLAATGSKLGATSGGFDARQKLRIAIKTLKVLS